MKTYLKILFFFIILGNADCQDLFYNISGGYSNIFGNIKNSTALNLHNEPAEFNKFCGSQNSLIGNVFFSINPESQIFAGLGYVSRHYDFAQFEYETIAINGEPIRGKFKRNFAVNSSSLAFNFGCGLNLGAFTFSVAASASSPVSGNYSQYEKIVFPADQGVFQETKQRVRNKFSGSFEGINSFVPAVFLSAEYLLKLDKKETVFLSPKLELGYELSDFIKNTNSSTYFVRAGASIYFFPHARQKRLSEIISEDAGRINNRLNLTVFQYNEGREELFEPAQITEVHKNYYILFNKNEKYTRLFFPFDYSQNVSMNSDSLKFYILGKNKLNPKDLVLKITNAKSKEKIEIKSDGSFSFSLKSKDLINFLGNSSKFYYVLEKNEKKSEKADVLSEIFESEIAKQTKFLDDYYLEYSETNSLPLISKLNKIIEQNKLAKKISIIIPKNISEKYVAFHQRIKQFASPLVTIIVKDNIKRYSLFPFNFIVVEINK